jgi:hypothetical protein
MAEKAKETEVTKDTFMVGEKEFTLSPLKGKKARRMVPRILEIVAASLNLASANGIDLGKFFTEDGQIPDAAALTKAAFALSQYFKDEYDTIESEVFPVVLGQEGKDWQFIDEEATPGDMFRALWIAIQYHLKTSFGIEVQEALKNLQEAAPQEEVEEQPE